VIGCVIALEIRAFEGRIVTVDTDPRKGIDDALRPFGTIARLVGVLDAEDEFAPQSLGQSPVVERGTGATDVKEASR
jgi:hypothetical protein